MGRKKTVLIVVAHADDLEFMAAGTVARFTQELHYDAFEYILTDNSKGSYRLSPKETAVVSAREAAEAGRILGLREVRFQGYRDGQLNEIHPNRLREEIMGFIREIKADIVMSWDPFAPYEDHPDHRMTAMATLEAAAFSGNPRFYPSQTGAHPVTEAYWFAKQPMNAKLCVDISRTIDVKIKALLAHDCQMELTVDSLVQEAKVLGADVPAFENMERSAYKGLIEASVRRWCEEVGVPQGFAYGELFRYEKLGMLDRALGTEFVQSDFA